MSLRKTTALGVAVASGGIFLALGPSHARPGPDTPGPAVRFLSALPVAGLSRAGAAVASLPIPEQLRGPLYSAYCPECVGEAELPLSQYRSFSDFFARKLRHGSRLIDAKADVVSPVDGTIVSAGLVGNMGVIPSQIKGVTYTARQLLDAEDRDPLTIASSIGSAEETELYVVVVRLSPRDCHRFGSPAKFKVTQKRHVRGGLFWPETRIEDGELPSYVRNERIVLRGEWEYGMFACAAIGAPGIKTIELDRDDMEGVSGRINADLKPGDSIGGFRLGSSFALVFEAPVGSFKLEVENGARVRAGEAIGRVESSTGKRPLLRKNDTSQEQAPRYSLRARRTW